MISEPTANGSAASGPGGGPTVGAVITNFNGGERVIRAVEALLRQKYALADIVVVDNASTDGSPQAIRTRFPAVRLLQQSENGGLSAARNRGLRELDTELAFLIDHDIYPEADAVDWMVRAFESERPAVVCPRIRLLPEREIVQIEGAIPHFVGTLTLRHGYRRVENLPCTPEEMPGAPGGCLLLERRSILDAGAFDERIFFYLEDLEFSLRVRSRGHRIWCEPRAEVYHERGDGSPELAFRGTGDYPRLRAELTMRNRLFAIFVHYRARTLLVLAPALLLYEFATLATAVRKGWLREWASAWRWQFDNVGAIAARRKRARRSRVVPDREILSGGPLPLAPGFVRSSLETKSVAALSAVLDVYWRTVRRWIA